MEAPLARQAAFHHHLAGGAAHVLPGHDRVAVPAADEDLGDARVGGVSARREREVLELMAAGRLDVSGSISGIYPLEAASEAVRRLASKEDAPVRLILSPRA